ncbi:RNase adapter RapZ [Motiliproteus sp. MSK22-1]|uniref:RNase adapter RapZ n=1 Tax=Motiliproteus sp. MSK22-1 TaxID=1897630 RepID=UPI000975BAF2|nr:RNase adapter RapZ [Motiliproteus sp. MSK22-1]OMH30368.1 RNase adaptor protein RapZ [Motiliproteus sp. MSK22-1]
MKLIIISGRSGSGKSTALQALEDLGYYCIDNLPVGLLPSLCEMVLKEPMKGKSGIAISIDARNTSRGLSEFPVIAEKLSESTIKHDIIYLDASQSTLLKRFSATRRRHPLSDEDKGLNEAIQLEKTLLEPMADLADLTIDTTSLTLYELRDVIKHRVAGRRGQEIALLFQSFGFKHGVPMDADLVYDVRCLPNPYWEPSLRKYTGQDKEVIDYLKIQPDVQEMLTDISNYLHKWLPRFENNNRSYLTICIGCTGGQHRSVFLAEALAGHFGQSMDNVLVKHRELSLSG